MEDEIKNVIMVWVTALASLTYCYLIPSKFPKGLFRFISLLPIFFLFTILPLNLTSVSLGGCTAFFLTWLCNFKLLLFSFNMGPLSCDPSISFSHFIFIACLPIKIKTNPSLKSFKTIETKQDPNENTKIQQNPSPQITTKLPKSPLNYAIKSLLIALLSFVYEHKQYIHPKLMLVYYCCFIYIGLELILVIVASMASALLNLELEPQFDEPYLSTSLQDFWGRRWNLMVPDILRPTVYDPIRCIFTSILGRKLAQLPAAVGTFLVSGLMHELIFFYFARVGPTWEVTWFFVLHGFCVAMEILVKKMVKDRWRLHPVVSGPLTVGFVIVTGIWLFFPQLIRCDADLRSRREVGALIGFVKDIGQTLQSFEISHWVYNGPSV